MSALCAAGDGADIAVALPSEAVLLALIGDAPPMLGSEYLTPSVLRTLWGELDAALRVEPGSGKTPLQDFLQSRHPVWNLVGRVHLLPMNLGGEPHGINAYHASTSRNHWAHWLDAGIGQ